MVEDFHVNDFLNYPGEKVHLDVIVEHAEKYQLKKKEKDKETPTGDIEVTVVGGLDASVADVSVSCIEVMPFSPNVTTPFLEKCSKHNIKSLHLSFP